MSTGYDIYIKAPDFRGTEDFARLLIGMGATNAVALDDDHYEDRWTFFYPGLDRTDIINMRLYPETLDEDDFGFGYDFDILMWTEFRDDNAERRESVLALASLLAERFEVFVVYNADAPFARNDEPGTALYSLREATDYIADRIKVAGVDTLTQQTGITEQQIGLE